MKERERAPGARLGSKFFGPRGDGATSFLFSIQSETKSTRKLSKLHTTPKVPCCFSIPPRSTQVDWPPIYRAFCPEARCLVDRPSLAYFKPYFLSQGNERRPCRSRKLTRSIHEPPHQQHQVKSRATPRGGMKAARSVNHRGLPGGGGLWVCMRRPQQLYGSRGMSVRARALRF